MAKLRFKVAKAKRFNPLTKKMGYAARVITNGTADYDDIAEDAAEDTTFNKDEIRAAAGIFCRAAAKMLKQGYIIDLGPIGKIYPSCTSGWFEKAEDLTMESVKPSIYFHAADEVLTAVKGATLTWAKAGEVTEAEENGTLPSDGGSGSGTGSGTGGGSSTGGGTTPGGDDNQDGME